MSELWLLLNALLIGIAPGADLQTPANPTEAFSRIRRACGAAHNTLLGVLNLIGHHRPFGFVQKLLVNYRIGGHRLWRRTGFTFHPTKTTVACPAYAARSMRMM